LSSDALPFFEDALRRAQERASEKLDARCIITVHMHLDETLMSKLEAIDHEKFRQELWYTHEEFVQKTQQRDFVCLILSVNGEPSAFLYGYDYAEDPKGFFLDEVATKIEGKGVGKILVALLMVYCFELGYESITLYTEESDEIGRRLREFYEHIGFDNKYSDPEKGLVMNYRIEETKLLELYNRIMHSEGGPHPPFLRG
jgi:ribosomal protein S18 acetylase RimI-like enzyme